MSLQPLTFPTKILAAPLSSVGTRLIMPDIEHWDGNDLTSGEVGTVIFATLQNFARTKMEIIELDPSTFTVATTTGILINKRACGYMGGTSASAETAYDWVANETYVQLGSNPPQLYTDLVDINENQTIAGIKTFTDIPVLPSTAPTSSTHAANKAYVDLVGTGTAVYDQNIIEGTAGATLSAGNLVYLQTSNQRWLKTDLSGGATAITGVKLGVAQGSATNGTAVNILIGGLEKNLTGLTAGSRYYASDTAGAFSTTPGTIARFVGIATSTTRLIFMPDELVQNIVIGTAGAALFEPSTVYLKPSDGKWYNTDANAASTSVGVQIGVLQADASLNGVCLVRVGGVETKIPALTAGTKYYLSGSAGLTSSTPGTFPRLVGTAIGTNQLLLGGMTDPAAVHQYGQEVYAASATGNDTYVVALNPTLPALFNGLTLHIKLDVANTGPATLNVDGTGALAIVTGISTPLVTGDTLANQIITVTYNSTGTVWQLKDSPGNLVGGGDAHTLHWHDEIYNAESALANHAYFRGGFNDGLTATQNATGTVTRGLAATGLFVTAAGDDAMLSNGTIAIDNISGDQAADFDSDHSYHGVMSIKFSATTEQDFFYGIVAAALAEAPANATLTTRHVAFMIEDGTIYASVADGTTQSRTDVSSGITLTVFNEFRFEFTGNGSALFYINGTLVATKATNTPVEGTSNVEFWCALTGVGANDKFAAIKHPFLLKVANYS